MLGDKVQRLEQLDQYVRDLSEAQAPTLEVFMSDKMLRRYTERMLHMSIDTCIQIAVGILTEQGFRSPENYRDVFKVLGEHAVLPPDVVKSMIALVEFRNLLVYEHEAIDETMVYGIAKRRLQDLTAFQKAVRAFWDRQVAPDSFPVKPPFPESPERLVPDQT